jgi:hypothetical protein
MNFVDQPTPQVNPNARMDPEQTTVAAEFIDELIELGIVLPNWANSIEVLLNAPLFVVAKEGQVGQWRVIADMLRGGQNSHIAPDPVYLPRVSHIVDLLYTGGFSAVVDASKFFYQFPTHPEDQPYLGLLHPITGILYYYGGLPMGGGNSPAVAGRFGNSFVRMLKERCTLFQGTPRANCWWTGFTDLGIYDPSLGYGYILENSMGLAVKVWVFVDDFLLHGPTYETTCQALSFFMDTALNCGMLCHPGKLCPPQQRVKYCGFLLDTTGIPCQQIPIPKRERALAMVEHLLESPEERTFSRLSLAVAAGTLESLVDATPHRLGSTYLRRFHSVVRPPGLGTGLEPYLTMAAIPTSVRRKELTWWRNFLRLDRGRQVRSRRSATLVPNWGDGSGTGTGGTLGIPNQPLKMWMGQWSVVVYKFSSNWKELETLRLTMATLLQQDRSLLEGTTIFYFTDNMAVYWIASSGSSPAPGLHTLIEEIRLMELELACSLQVVHVPGIIMINQGTDGLSRGIWMSALHLLADQRTLTRAIFDPLPPCPYLVNQVLSDFLGPCQWYFHNWEDQWDGQSVFGRLTVWFPPPEIARQVITFVLESWVECPRTTSALFFIPRTVPAFWFGLSRYIVELTTLHPHLVPLPTPGILPIPIVVLYLPPHQPVLSPNRLDSTRPTPLLKWHREQAAQLRRLPPRSVAWSGNPQVSIPFPGIPVRLWHMVYAMWGHLSY